MRFRQTQGKCRLLWHNNSTHFTCRLFTKAAAFGIALDDDASWEYDSIFCRSKLLLEKLLESNRTTSDQRQCAQPTAVSHSLIALPIP
jgi:hypothetical protein